MAQKRLHKSSSNNEDQVNFFDPLQVCLSGFEGPLELLLALIRKHKMEVWEIPLAEICEPYLAYLKRMEALNLEVAGNFLEIASTLILIKSRALLPRNVFEEDLDGEEDLNTEEVLRQRLAEYQKFKDAAFALGQQKMLGKDWFPRPMIEEDPTDLKGKTLLESPKLTVYQLLKAYQTVCAKNRSSSPHLVEQEQYPIEKKILELLEQFFSFEDCVLFDKLFDEDATRVDLVITFLAVLELAKLRLIKLQQVEAFSPLYCYPQKEQQERIFDLQRELLEAS